MLAARKSPGYAKPMRRFLTILMLAALTALPAQALVLPPLPAGDCAIDVSQPFDRTATNYMHLVTQTPGTLQALFTECGQLEKLRLQQRLFLNYYGAVIEQKESLPQGITRAQLLDGMADAIGLSGTMATKAMNANDPSVAAIASQASYHGILKQSDQLLVLGSEQRHVGTRAPYVAAAVTALTVVDGKVVSVNFYAPLTQGVYERLGARAEAYTNALLAANP